MIPWRQWFLFAVLSLGLTPEDFWALTLSEWRFLAPEEGAAMTRGGLQRLIALYPDESAVKHDPLIPAQAGTQRAPEGAHEKTDSPSRTDMGPGLRRDERGEGFKVPFATPEMEIKHD